VTGPRPERPALHGTPRLRPRDFARFQALVQQEAGIFLSQQKEALLVGRLSRRLRELAITDFGDYFDRVVADPAEKVRCLDLITTNETHFFREPRHFQLLESHLLPRLAAEIGARRRPSRVRAWSAACSSGEEPWSIAMTLLAAFPPGTGTTVEVLATDLSTRVLQRASAGLYPIEKAKDIPEPLRKAFMLRGTGASEGLMSVGPELRGVVSFARQNLVDPDWPGIGAFDLVFCRNVLIYFAHETKRAVVRHLLSHLVEDGILFLGHAESLSGLGLPAHAIAPTVMVHEAGPLDPRRPRQGSPR
jgi:chemotaxis protein methyltransferase CheR